MVVLYRGAIVARYSLLGYSFAFDNNKEIGVVIAFFIEQLCGGNGFTHRESLPSLLVIGYRLVVSYKKCEDCVSV